MPHALLGDEIERCANRALDSRLSKAHFEDSDKTFENFDWTFNPKLPQEQLRDLATGGYFVRKEHILLCAPADIRSHYPSLWVCIGNSPISSALSSMRRPLRLPDLTWTDLSLPEWTQCRIIGLALRSGRYGAKSRRRVGEQGQPPRRAVMPRFQKPAAQAEPGSP